MGQDQSTGAHNSLLGGFHIKQKAKLTDIVVVTAKSKEKKKEKCDEDLQHLKSIRISNPILMHFSGGKIDYKKVPRIASLPFTDMLLWLQLHLTESAEVVSLDQDRLAKKVKEVNAFAASISKHLNERHKCIDDALSQIDNIVEVSSMMDNIEVNLKHAKMQFNCLNKYLLEDEQIHDDEFSEE